MPKNPVVMIRFKKFGTVKAELYPEYAPETVRNFLRLIERGYYNGLRVHQAIPHYMIQAGCPLGRGNSGPGYGIRGEFTENGFPNPLKHTAGALTMIRGELPDSAGSIFAILTGDIPSMDGKQAVFGSVIEGLDVVDAMTMVPRSSNNRPYILPKIEKMEADTFGIDFGKPEFLDLQRKVVTLF
jgi:peptidyl-prolyl cis-trans isomerase B (cyclophilin B)